MRERLPSEEVRKKERGNNVFEIKEYAICILVTLVLLGIEAMVSSGIAALENVSETELKKKAEDGEVKAKTLLREMQLLEQNPSFLLLVMTSLNLAIGFIYSRCIVYWSEVVVQYSDQGMLFWLARRLFQLFGMLLLILVVSVFGNAMPRKLALKHSEQKAHRYAWLVLGLMRLFHIFAMVVDCSVLILFKLTGKNVKDYEECVTEEEIISIVNEGLEQGILENNEVEMIANIIEMDEKEVRDIMTRRTKIVAMDANLTLEEAIQFMLANSYSRFPVYEGDIDNIIGIVFWKDLTKYYIQHEEHSVQLRDLAKKPYLIPDTQKIDVLFEEMQLKKIHMAIAIDEYGQTAGIVAMEDVLEEIVGNIFDEFDVDERMIIRQRDGKYFMRGMAPLEDVAAELGLNMDEELEDYDTLNGFLISQLGHIPKEKEKVNIMYKGYEFRVVDIKDRMIRFVRVHREEKEKTML